MDNTHNFPETIDQKWDYLKEKEEIVHTLRGDRRAIATQYLDQYKEYLCLISNANEEQKRISKELYNLCTGIEQRINHLLKIR